MPALVHFLVILTFSMHSVHAHNFAVRLYCLLIACNYFIMPLTFSLIIKMGPLNILENLIYSHSVTIN